MRTPEQIRLKFDPVDDRGDPPATQLSAAVRLVDTLIVAADEGGNLEILVPHGENWRQVARISLHGLIRLPADEDVEIDIEGLAADDGWLWVVGSHSLKRQKPRGKSPRQDLNDLREVKREANRFVLARLPLALHEDGYLRPVDRDGARRAAMAEIGKRSSVLMSWLAEDPMLAPFLEIPSKENGLDIEGLAARGDRVWLGLRGPVLRGHALVLQLDLKANKRDVLKARKVDGTRRFRKCLLPLDGLGVRDLELDGKDLLILTGPTMQAPGPARIVRWVGGAEVAGSEVVGDKRLHQVLELAVCAARDTPEAICHWDDGRLLVLHDNPAPERLSADRCNFRAEIHALPD